MEAREPAPKKKRRGLKIAGIVVAVFVGLGIIGAFLPEEDTQAPEQAVTETTEVTAEEEDSTAEEAEVAEEEPSFNAETYAARIEKAFVAYFGRPINKACDVKDPTWHCYYTGIEASSESWVNMTLTFDGGVSEDQARDMAQQAGLGFFNFIGEDFEKLDTIVVYDGTGLDIGTIYRCDVLLLN